MIKPNKHILNSIARSFISSNFISKGEAISQSHSHMEDSNYHNNDINIYNNPIIPIKNNNRTWLIVIQTI